MKPSENTIKAFYQHVGKLFYAVAIIDHHIRDEELDKLIEIVKNDWSSLNNTETNNKINVEASIINTFRWLQDDNEYDAETCYNNFIAFKNNHPSLFTKEIKDLILNTAGAIAFSFSDINKSELIILAKLNLEFKKVS